MASPLCTYYNYDCVDCPSELQGRITAIALVDQCYKFADDAAIALTQTWVDLICNPGPPPDQPLAFIINEITGTYDGGSPSEKTGYGAQQTYISTYDRSITYKQKLTCENIDFYNYLRLNTSLKLWYVTGDPTNSSTDTETRLWETDSVVGVAVSAPIEDSLGSNLEFNVTLKWSNKLMPKCKKMPPYIFASCKTLKEAVACGNCTRPVCTLCP